MSGCGYPGCDWDGGHRPYSRKGTPSVTTVIALGNFGEKARKFAWAAAEVAATEAVHGTGWQELGTEGCTKDHSVEPGLCPACRLLRSEFDRRWRAKAALGEHLHHLAASWAAGEEIESDDVVDPWLDSLERWWAKYQPKWLHNERTVCHRKKNREWVGTFDAIAEIDCPTCSVTGDIFPPRCLWLLDFKSSDGCWITEWAPQLAAYRNAEHLTEWVEGKEIITEAMPAVAHCGVIWLKPEGNAELVPVDAGGEELNVFLRLLDLYHWERKLERSLRGDRTSPSD